MKCVRCNGEIKRGESVIMVSEYLGWGWSMCASFLGKGRLAHAECFEYKKLRDEVRHG